MNRSVLGNSVAIQTFTATIVASNATLSVPYGVTFLRPPQCIVLGSQGVILTPSTTSCQIVFDVGEPADGDFRFDLVAAGVIA